MCGLKVGPVPGGQGPGGAMVGSGRLLLECLFRHRVCVYAVLCLCGRSFVECLFRQRRRVLTLFAFPFRLCLRSFRVAQELRGSNVVATVVVVSIVVVSFGLFSRVEKSFSVLEKVRATFQS